MNEEAPRDSALLRTGMAIAATGRRAGSRSEEVRAAPPRENRPLPHRAAAPGELPRARAPELGPASAEVRGERVPTLPRVRFARARLRPCRLRDLWRRAALALLVQLR